MKTLICYPEALANSNSINLGTWIIANHLENQGYDVFYNEVPEGEDINLECYFDQLALYCLEDCLTPATLKRIVMSRHIIHSYSTTNAVVNNLNEAFKPVIVYPIPSRHHHRLDFVHKDGEYLPELVWKIFHKKSPPKALKDTLSYVQFNQLLETYDKP